MCYILLAIDIPVETNSVVILTIKPCDLISSQVLKDDKPICELFVPIDLLDLN